MVFFVLVLRVFAVNRSFPSRLHYSTREGIDAADDYDIIRTL